MSAQPGQRRLRLLVVGVGGQGALTAARFAGEACLHAGHEVMVSQLHGMSQRGGSVECAVLIGAGESAFVGDGQADVVLALEPLEALRARPQMSAETTVVVSRGTIVPFPLAQRGESYPPVDGILDQLREVTPRVHELDAATLAQRAGAPRSLNAVMVGALGALELLPVTAEALLEAVSLGSPARFRDINRRAFELGGEAISPRA